MLIQTVQDIDNGMEVEVSEIESGKFKGKFSVALKDADCGEYTGSVQIFAVLADALAKAQEVNLPLHIVTASMEGERVLIYKADSVLEEYNFETNTWRKAVLVPRPLGRADASRLLCNWNCIDKDDALRIMTVSEEEHGA